MPQTKTPIPEGYHTVTPQLTFDDAGRAIDFYKRALGADELSRSVAPDGKIMHAALKIGTSIIMLNDAMGGGKSAKALGGSPISLWVYVEDCDALFNQAVAAGAQIAPGPMGKLGDQFWGDRCGMVTDPFGVMWTIATHKEDVSRDEMNRRIQAFYAQVTEQEAHA